MKKSSEKSFGILFGIVFLLISLWPLFSSNNLRLWALIISLIFFIITFLKPKILKPLNNIWIKFGEILGKVVAPIVMGIVFFVVLTPISLIVRAFGKDLLGLKITDKKNSYWIRRKKDVGTMDKQF
tara:strand:+ start:90 stop:467 length:378 start_codon:yes stop_codon:yes gene_type:complete